jgi:hypothetical protein
VIERVRHPEERVDEKWLEGGEEWRGGVKWGMDFWTVALFGSVLPGKGLQIGYFSAVLQSKYFLLFLDHNSGIIGRLPAALSPLMYTGWENRIIIRVYIKHETEKM